MYKVSIIAVNFNGHAVTEDFLSSVLHHRSEHQLECIVVDNGSQTDPTENWKNQYPTVLFIRSATNLGFAGGNNLGIRAATGDFLFLVNNDTLFTDGLVDTLVNALLAQPQTGVVCPLIHFFDHPQVLQFAGYTPMNYFLARNATLGLGEKDQGQFGQNTYPTAFVHGAAMMIRRAALEQVGPMPEHYFLYYEEFDWSEMFKRKGWELAVVSRVFIVHKESMAVGKASALKTYFMTRNRMLFIRRNANFWQKAVFFPYFILTVVPKESLQALWKGNLPFVKQLWRAVRWNLFHGVNSPETGFKP